MGFRAGFSEFRIQGPGFRVTGPGFAFEISEVDQISGAVALRRGRRRLQTPGRNSLVWPVFIEKAELLGLLTLF